MQIGGNHYLQFKFQPTDFIHKIDLNFCQGNVIKYVCRYKFKNGKEDLFKALHYAEMLKDYYLKGYPSRFILTDINKAVVMDFIYANELLHVQSRVIHSVVKNDYNFTIQAIKELIELEYPNV